MCLDESAIIESYVLIEPIIHLDIKSQSEQQSAYWYPRLDSPYGSSIMYSDLEPVDDDPGTDENSVE